MAVEVRDNREDPAVRTRTVLWLVGGFLVVVATAMLGLHHFYRKTSSGVVTTLGMFPIPEIQPNPAQDLRSFRERQNAQLAGYSWVDQSRGVAHIPIERAMDLIVSRGPAALDPLDQGSPTQPGNEPGGPPDGAPRAPASLPASPYGAPR